MIGTMMFDYENPSANKRRRCPSCGAFLGPAATYCDRCGASASGVLKRRKWPLVLLILIIAGVGYFHFSDSDLIDRVVQEANRLWESTKETLPDKPPPTPAKPQAKPENAVPPPEVPKDVPKLKVGRTYKTQRGYAASLQQDWMLKFQKLTRENNQKALEKMRKERQIGNLKAGLTVELLEFSARQNWVRVRIQGKKTVFYTVPEALMD